MINKVTSYDSPVIQHLQHYLLYQIHYLHLQSDIQYLKIINI
jgi:hypothetical protein